MTAIITGNTPDTDVSAVFDRMKKILDESGATSIDRLDVGKHKLAYKTKNEQFGHYAVFVFECDPAAMPVIEQKSRLNKDLVRFVFERYIYNRYKKPPVVADSPLIKASREREREERAERGERQNHGGDRGERVERSADVVVPVFAPSATVVSTKVEPIKEIDLEDIDKKLDELLQGDLTPTI